MNDDQTFTPWSLYERTTLGAYVLVWGPPLPDSPAGVRWRGPINPDDMNAEGGCVMPYLNKTTIVGVVDQAPKIGTLGAGGPQVMKFTVRIGEASASAAKSHWFSVSYIAKSTRTSGSRDPPEGSRHR